MSLLLDALKQAEKNKQEQDGEKNIESTAPSQPEGLLMESEPENAELAADDNLIELDVLPDFDLTVQSEKPVEDAQTASATETPHMELPSAELSLNESKEDPGLSLAEVEVAQEEETKEEIEEDTHAEQAIDVVSPEESADVVEELPEDEASSKPVADDPQQHEQIPAERVDEPVSDTTATDAEAARNVLLVSNAPRQNKRYWLLLLLILVLGGAGLYLYYLAKPAPIQYEADDEFIIEDGMGDLGDLEDVTGASQQSIKNDSVQASANSASLQVMAKPEQPEKTEQLPVQQEILETEVTEESGFAVDYPDQIQVTVKRQASSTLNQLNQAYQAYQANDLKKAQNLYTQILRRDQQNVDALLGLASIAEQYGFLQRAKVLYEKILILDGNHLYAQNALVRMQKSHNKVKSESHYKQLINKYPQHAQSYVSLANLYVAQQRWHDAQQAFFKAVELDATNPDYQFNLAISLDHLGKHSVALRYYQQALQLAKAHPAAFDSHIAEKRIQQLQAE